MNELSDVCLAIATFRSDDAVIRLLDSIPEGIFRRVVIVDSLGTARIERVAQQRGWSWVSYVNANENLGSAGNLAMRLKLSAQAGAEFVYALNHDGHVDLDAIRALVAAARDGDRLGAVYPLRRYINRGGRFRSHAGKRSLLHRAATERPYEPITETDWSSSNGALYVLEPVRRGLLPHAELWMGWEDYDYGLQLALHGYRQIVLNTVVVDDPYEYVKKNAGPIELYITDKPTWYQYYMCRNLLLIGRRDPSSIPTTVKKLVAEMGVIALFRDRKAERLRYMAAGALDGLRGRGGKWRRP